jgi:hypothetical protein
MRLQLARPGAIWRQGCNIAFSAEAAHVQVVAIWSHQTPTQQHLANGEAQKSPGQQQNKPSSHRQQRTLPLLWHQTRR